MPAVSRRYGFLKAGAHVKLAEAEVAQKCFDRAIRFDKSKPEYHRALGALLISQDKLANAKKVFQRVLAVSKQIGSAQLQADSCTGLAKRI